MTDIELLPLPQAEEWEDTTAWAKRYARSVAEHNVRLRGGIDPLAVLIRAQEAEARAEQLQAELDTRWAQGVHTCHDKCQRIACVLRRDNKRLAEALQAVVDALGHPLPVMSAGHVYLPERVIRPALDTARAALRDHDQEGKDG